MSDRTPDPDDLLAAGRPGDAGRILERRGCYEDALRCYQRAGVWADAARVQVRLRRFDEAAASFLRALPTELTPVQELSPRALRSAFQAAVCYARSDRVGHAVSLFISLGEFGRAAEVLERANRRQDAALVAGGHPLADSPWPLGLLSSGPAVATITPTRPPPNRLQRAVTLLESGHPQRALEVLQGIGHLHPTYPEAVARAVQIAWRDDIWTPELDEFVGPFLVGDEAGDHAPDHAPTLYSLGRIFQRLCLHSSAAAAFAAVVEVVPRYRDAQLRLAELQPFHLHPDFQEDAEEDLSLPSFSGPAALAEEPKEAPPRRTPADLDTQPNLAAGTPSTASRSSGRHARSPRVTPPSRPTPAALRRAVLERTQELGLGPVAPGSVIADRYLVQEPLGQGGYAVVFKARDLELQESVALKLFTPKEADQRAVERFRREMRIARQLAHPNIVASYEFGTLRDAYFITMELLEGSDLYTFSEEVHWGMVPTDLALHLCGQALDGLGAAHEMGVVHRDVKLRNLFVVGAGSTLKVMDFGIATMTGGGTGLTRTGMVVGTPAFVAPERLKPRPDAPRPAVDIYAVGVVLYRLLTGVLPFDRRSVAALFNDILTRDPRPVSVLNPEVPPDVEAIVARMLAKDPRDRFPDCATARQAVDEARLNLRRLG